MDVKRAGVALLGAIVLSAGVAGSSFGFKLKPGGKGGSPGGGTGGQHFSPNDGGQSGGGGNGTQGGFGGSSLD